MCSICDSEFYPNKRFNYLWPVVNTDTKHVSVGLMDMEIAELLAALNAAMLAVLNGRGDEDYTGVAYHRWLKLINLELEHRNECLQTTSAGAGQPVPAKPSKSTSSRK